MTLRLHLRQTVLVGWYSGVHLRDEYSMEESIVAELSSEERPWEDGGTLYF